MYSKSFINSNQNKYFTLTFHYDLALIEIVNEERKSMPIHHANVPEFLTTLLLYNQSLGNDIILPEYEDCELEENLGYLTRLDLIRKEDLFISLSNYRGRSEIVADKDKLDFLVYHGRDNYQGKEDYRMSLSSEEFPQVIDDFFQTYKSLPRPYNEFIKFADECIKEKKLENISFK